MAKVYTASKTIEHFGTLPITINADGNALLDYRIYGAAGGVGDRTENIYNYTYMGYGYIGGRSLNIAGAEIVNSNWCISSYIEVKPSATYTINWYNGVPYSSAYLCEYDENYNFIGSVLESSNKTFTISQQTKYLRLSNTYRNVERSRREACVLVEGSTAPAKYVPYGYEVPIAVRTANLFDKNAEGVLVGYRINSLGNIGVNTNTTVSDYMPIIGDEIYTIVGSAQQAAYSNAFYDSSKNLIGVTPTTATITAPSNAAFLRITMINENVPNAMVVESSTAPSTYIPYFNTTTPIYIGNDPLEAIGDYADYVDYQSGKIVRQITQKIVLTGQENYKIDPSTFVFTIDQALPATPRDDALAPSIASNTYSGYKSVGVYPLLPDKHICVRSTYKHIWIRDTDYTTVTDFQAHLAEQYALGNPVVIWYVRGTFINEDPPVPLPALPTVDGTTIINYDGTPKPSQMYIKYNILGGWIDCVPRVLKDGNWREQQEYIRRNGVWVQQT